jgi:RHS repeat-associated protein
VNAPSWSGAYTYDGFGNQPTNIAYIAYDGNGNVTQFGPSGSLTAQSYDVANGLATVDTNGAYTYNSANQRTYFRNSSGTETLYIYGPGGKKLATYTITGTNPVAFTLQSENVYFAGRLISAEGNAVAVDRLGSVRWSAATGAHTYYPYGVEYNTTTNDTEKYGTYTRDSLTGLDYAMNRYYASFWGRFMTPDKSSRGASKGNPQSWNRYAYTLSDPVNRNDPSGLCTDMIAGITMSSGSMPAFNGLAGNLGASMAFPYNEGMGSSVASVIAQGSGPNASTEVALASILNTLANNPGSIDIVAYSGGAAAFTDAYGQLTAAQQDRIGSVLYISPGVNGLIQVVPDKTTVVFGSGYADFGATFATVVPVGTPVIWTGCDHSDLACLATAAGQQLRADKANGGCHDPMTYSLIGAPGGGATPAQYGNPWLGGSIVDDPFLYLDWMLGPGNIVGSDDGDDDDQETSVSSVIHWDLPE